MIERGCRFGVGRTRRARVAFGSMLAVTLCAMGLLAPSGQAAALPFTSFSPVLAGFGPVPSGTSASKTFTLKNSGGAATGQLSIALVGSSTFKVTSDQCTGVKLGAGKSCTVTVTYKPTAGGAHDFTTLWAYGQKPVTVALAGLAGTSPVTPKADLSITKTDGASSVTPGTQTTYTIVASNAGPSAVTGAKVADVMPSAISSDTYTATPSGGATGFTSASGNINDTVNLPVGSSITYTVNATVTSSATPTLSLSNTATVSVPAGVIDPNTSNNSATDTDTIGASQTCSPGCTVTASGADGSTVSVNAAGPSGTTSTVQAAVFTGTLGCTYGEGDLNQDPNTYEVLSSNPAFSKKVTLSYTASLTTETNEQGGPSDGDGDFDDAQVCFQAPYPFTPKAGTTLSGPDANGFYTGLLPDCPATGPCVDRVASTFTPIGETGTNFQFNMVVVIPAGQPSDPRMA